MSGASAIEWCDATWNPTRGCSRVSEGCRNCFAERIAARFSDRMEIGAGTYRDGTFQGYAEQTKAGPRWTGRVQLVESALDWPLRWRGDKRARAEGRPSRVFVNSMSDLFHERLSDEEIAAVFGVMAASPQHVFQVLTKRPERALRWFEWLAKEDEQASEEGHVSTIIDEAENAVGIDKYGASLQISWVRSIEWPLPNVWLGVSVEDQATADERIPLLLQCPAAVRFVSYEPALGAVDFARWLRLATMRHVAMSVEGAIRNRAYDCLQTDDGKPMTRREAENELFALHARGVKLVPAGDCEGFDSQNGCPGHRQPRLDWLIVGGESGPGARPCHVDWIRSVRDQCKAANVACFIKQMGRRVFGDSEGFLVDRYILDGGAIEWQPPIIGFDKARFLRDNADRIVGFKPYDSKGGRWDEWPEDLRVREFPSVPLLDRQRDERGEGR